jgi:hypothetical protein
MSDELQLSHTAGTTDVPLLDRRSPTTSTPRWRGSATARRSWTCSRGSAGPTASSPTG